MHNKIVIQYITEITNNTIQSQTRHNIQNKTQHIVYKLNWKKKDSV